MTTAFYCHNHGWCTTVYKSPKGGICAGCESARADAKWDAAFEAKFGRRPTQADRWLDVMKLQLNRAKKKRSA